MRIAGEREEINGKMYEHFTETPEVGSVVQIKTSTFDMTVTEVGSHSAAVVWFTNDGLVHRDRFPLPCFKTKSGMRPVEEGE